MIIAGYIVIGVIVLLFLSGMRIINQKERGLVETLGKYTAFRQPGFNWVIPIFQRLRVVNISERMTDIEPQEIITKDNLNAKVDLVVYYQIKSDERNVCASQYNVDEVINQLDTLARTTARNVIGTMPFRDVNSKRNELNEKLRRILVTETKNWGVDVLKVELKDITPPGEVQETMNMVIMAENKKDAAGDLATATETEADGERRAAIKRAEGVAQGRIIVAEANAKKIKIENEAATKYFVGNAQKLKQLEVTQASLQNNSKVVLTEKGIKPSIILGELPVSSKN
jgi:regulator of protease activity HflC (stomatin/prohibitin superfamily)